MRRLRVQQRIKSADLDVIYSEEIEMPDIPSTIPFIPRMVSFSSNSLFIFIEGILAHNLLESDNENSEAALFDIFLHDSWDHSFWRSPCTSSK